MKRALVTGNAGFVGRHLEPKLQQAGYYVTGVEDMMRFLSHSHNPSFDVVVHLAANIRDVDARMKSGMNAYGDILLDHAMCDWLEHYPPHETAVLLSSCAVDFPDDPYCTVKRTLEAYAKTLAKRGVPVTVLRPFSGYGPDQAPSYPFRAILERVRRREDPLTVWGGPQIRDWVHIDDLTDAIVHAIHGFPQNASPVDIGTGGGTDFFTLARMMATAAHYNPEVHGVTGRAVGSPERIANTHLAAAHGWTAKISLRLGIAGALNAAA